MRTSSIVVAAGATCAAVIAGQLRAWPGPGGRAGSVSPVAAGGDAGGVAGGCTPRTGPDVIVGDLGPHGDICTWGTIAGVSAYSVATDACNIGDEVLLWQGDTNKHPVIAQHLYRQKGGRFEQIGLSWVKHGFAADTRSLCCPCQNPNDNQLLGVGCSDAYEACQNGDQAGFPGCGGICQGSGPRYQINATTGEYPYPYATIGQGGNLIYKRLQVHSADLDPSLNAGALYYAEAQYLTADDATAGNHHNNASYEEALVGPIEGGTYPLHLVGDTTPALPAIYAWRDNDPQVVIEVVEDDGGAPDDHDGRFHMGYRVTGNGDGTWHYEWALYNMNSHRSARSFSVPVGQGAVLSNVGFHDVDYHSGDGEGNVTFDGADWAFAAGGPAASWSTSTFQENANANALRWGTLYNFRFDADQPPVGTTATIGLFRPGSPAEITVLTLGPGPEPAGCPVDCADGDGDVDVTDLLALLADWGQVGGPCDTNGDGVGVNDLLALLGIWGPCP